MKFQKITPYLWFDYQAKDAAEFYCTIFKNSRIVASSPLIVQFEIEGLHFMALNGGPKFKFNESVSFFVNCVDQHEIDHLWNALTENGGSESKCGWCRDKFGLWWQIVPERLMELMRSSNEAQSKKLMEALLSMDRIVIEDLENSVKV
ncbi:MAG: VOC family protein [Flavobacteriales bacterium]|nr:VOC family protein [Flavobacteriales bacterium]